MEFNKWFKKRNVNEAIGSSQDLPRKLQNSITKLSAANDLGFYLIFPRATTTNTFVMTGEQIDNMYERLKRQYGHIINVYNAEGTKPDIKQKIKKNLDPLILLGNELKTELNNWKKNNPEWATTNYTVHNTKLRKSDIQEGFFDDEHPFSGLGVDIPPMTYSHPKTGGIVKPKIKVQDNKIIISQPFFAIIAGKNDILKTAKKYTKMLQKIGHKVTLEQNKSDIELVFYNNEKAQRAFYYLKQNA